MSEQEVQQQQPEQPVVAAEDKPQSAQVRQEVGEVNIRQLLGNPKITFVLGKF
jgi:hypothetical protein